MTFEPVMCFRKLWVGAFREYKHTPLFINTVPTFLSFSQPSVDANPKVLQIVSCVYDIQDVQKNIVTFVWLFF
jgi:hypothetical protein